MCSASDEFPTETRATLEDILGLPVASVQEIHAGRNARVMAVTVPDGREFVAKFYFDHPADPRDRLGVEFTALTFLGARGVGRVPRPVTMDRKRRCAFYERVRGQRVENVGPPDVDDLVGFLAELGRLTAVPDSLTLPAASDACFSVPEILANIRERVARLKTAAGDHGQGTELRAFLGGEFSEALERWEEWSPGGHPRSGWDQPVPRTAQTLSPSDFGFHNALRKGDGTLVYLDFEYFGWDDPAKMVADFLLHPAMDLGRSLKRRFAKGVVDEFRWVPHLAHRVRRVYPLFGLKWCTILLNEFVPEHRARRAHAGVDGGALESVQARQLGMARNLLRRVTDEYRDLPYLH